MAKICNKPRNTIARWINVFKRKNLYQTRYLPDLSRLGIQIQSFYTLSIRGFSKPLVQNILNLIIAIMRPIDLFVSSREIFISTIASDYFSHREIEASFFEQMNEYQFPYLLQKKVDLSISNMRVKKSLQDSFRPLIDYLQSDVKYSIKPYLNGND